MTSGFSGDLFYGTNTTQPTTLPGFQQQQQPQQQQILPMQQQQILPMQQQGVVFSTMDQILQRRRGADLLIGKRSFGDYQQQSFQTQQQQQSQHNSLLLLQQQKQQATLSYLQQQQQQQQRQYLLRSVKPRTNLSSSSPTNNNINISNYLSSPSTRFGVPVYGQPQQQQFFNNNNININNNYVNINKFNTSNNCLMPNLLPTNTNHLINPIQTQSPGYSNFGPILAQQKPEHQPGFTTHVESGPPKMVVDDSDDYKILNTLHELEKKLLNDDDDDNNGDENDAVSGITNSEWCETFQNLMGPGPGPGPSPNMNQSITGSTNTNANNVISPSPTSSTSSCCSTSAPPQLPPQQETLTVKQLISEAANAISDGKIEIANEFLTRLARISNPKGNSEQRLGFYLGNALRCRAFPGENPAPVLELYSNDQMQAMYSLHDVSPCFKFGLLAANLVMLETITIALQEGVNVHIIDFDVGQGAQYVNLLRALAERRMCGVDCKLKITVVETEFDNRGGIMESVRDGLIKLAERVGINLKFEGLTRKITELTRESLGCIDGEAIVVNLAFNLHRVPDESVSIENLRDKLLRRVKGINPRAVTLVEQEMNGNTAPFMTRVNEACGYYSALFDSLEATLPRDNMDRVRVEAGIGRKMANAVACEGRERVERMEVFGKWRARMSMAGFELKPLNRTVVESMRAKLNSARNGNPGFTVKEESGGVGCGWMGRTLTVASAWC